MIAPPPPATPLRDEAVSLRGYAEADVDDLVAGLRDPDIVRWTNVPAPYLRGHALDFLARGADLLGERTFGIRDATDDRLLGAIGARLADDRSYAELGYWVAAGERGRGVVTRAIGLVTRWLLDEVGVPGVRIHVHPDNAASLRAAEKAGFEREPGLHERPHRSGTAAFVRLSR